MDSEMRLKVAFHYAGMGCGLIKNTTHLCLQTSAFWSFQTLGIS